MNLIRRDTCYAFVFVVSILGTGCAYQFSSHDVIQVNGSRLFVGGQPFFLQGVAYSPVPVGDTPRGVEPLGDYFTCKYKRMWQRDFPKMKAMGANAVRVYSWDPNVDHTCFLDFAYEHGIKVFVTWYLGDARTTSLNSTALQRKHIDEFAAQVARYADHPALLGWSFGNEINHPRKGFLQYFSDVGDCRWDPACMYADANNPDCKQTSVCVYRGFFHFIDSALSAAQHYNPNGQILTTALADIDNLEARISQFNSQMSHMDIWSVQLYRGPDFGKNLASCFFCRYPEMSAKLLMVSEYGIDAYDDPCGKQRKDACCENPVSDDHENEDLQASYGLEMAATLREFMNDRVIGGFHLAWQDEYWKGGAELVSLCQDGLIGEDAVTRPDILAHKECPVKGFMHPSLCGYYAEYPFDNYVNEAWFGINRVQRSFLSYDVLEPRKLFGELQKLWKGTFEVYAPPMKTAPGNATMEAWKTFNSTILWSLLVVLLVVGGIIAFHRRRERSSSTLPRVVPIIPQREIPAPNSSAYQRLVDR